MTCWIENELTLYRGMPLGSDRLMPKIDFQNQEFIQKPTEYFGGVGSLRAQLSE